MNVNTTASTTSSSSSSTNQSSSNVGPRAKCDQVVYEAIAKAAEIIVRGRCHVEDNTNHNSASSNRRHAVDTNGYSGGGRRSLNHNSGSNHGNGGGGGKNKTGASVSRFHLEVEEVDLVRSILQNWRKSLHIPLRLDIYYEYQTPLISPDGTTSTTKTTTRKDLLERWCIDYLPTFDSSSSPPPPQTVRNNEKQPQEKQHYAQNPQMKRANSMDEIILQLRQVVKRVIIFLRVLNSFTRLMPGYKLHHALMTQKYQQQKLNNNQYYGQRLEGGGPGMRGGYYSQQQQQQQHRNHYQQHQQKQSSFSEQRELIGGSIKFLFCVSSDPPPPPSNNSNNSTSNAHDLNLTQQRLFSSTTNNPFARHDLSPIPTPYGVLHLSALYDDGLNVQRVMNDRARRLMEWDAIMSRCNGGADGTGTGSMTITKAIPIRMRDDGGGGGSGQNNQNQKDANQHPQQQNYMQTSRRHSYQPQMMMNSKHHPSSAVQQQQVQHQQYLNQQHHPQHAYQQEQTQPMSLPNPTISNNVISEHLIQNYARSPVMGSSSNSRNRNTQTNLNQPNQQNGIRDRLGSDPGHGLARRGSGSKRVLSGLSLALMNDDQEQDQISQRRMTNSPSSLSSSPLLNQSQFPAATSEEAACWKQRVALHHPPPSFDSNCQVQQAVSVSPQNVGGLHNPTPATQTYGYGYNQGKAIPVPVQSSRDCNSPSPVVSLGNTPPQPLFIGSLPRHALGPTRNGKEEDAGEVLSPPFRNPVSLQDIPPAETSPSYSSKSSMQLQRQIQTIGVSGVITNTTQGKSQNVVDNMLLPPLTNMDGLASSPFKFPTPGYNSSGPTTGNTGSAFSSLTLGKGSAMAFGPDGDGPPLALTSGIFGTGGGGSSGGYLSSLGPGRSGSEFMFRSSGQIPLNHEDDENDIDDMPFAVEENDEQMNGFSGTGISTSGSIPQTFLKQSSNHQDSNSPMILSSGAVSSQVVTSFAHRCATAGRLKLFDNSANPSMQEEAKIDNNQMEGNDNTMALLSSQLEDLKSFGESIMSTT